MTDAEFLRGIARLIAPEKFCEELLRIADRLDKIDRTDDDPLGSILGEK